MENIKELSNKQLDELIKNKRRELIDTNGKIATIVKRVNTYNSEIKSREEDIENYFKELEDLEYKFDEVIPNQIKEVEDEIYYRLENGIVQYTPFELEEAGQKRLF